MTNLSIKKHHYLSMVHHAIGHLSTSVSTMGSIGFGARFGARPPHGRPQDTDMQLQKMEHLLEMVTETKTTS